MEPSPSFSPSPSLRRKIAKEKEKVAVKEVFLSGKFERHLRALIYSITDRYRHSVRLIVDWDERRNADIAYTNNDLIYINAGNHIAQSFPNLALKECSIIGFIGHELGHCLFTDFEYTRQFNLAWKNGKLCFSLFNAEELSDLESQNLIKLRAVLDSRKEPMLTLLLEIIHDYWNIMEDGYVNALMCQKYTGSIQTGILLNSRRTIESCHSILASIKMELPPSSIVRNALLQYVLCGKYNNLGNHEGKMVDTIEDCIPYVSGAVYASNIECRYKAAVHILLRNWDDVMPELEKESEQLKAGEQIAQVIAARRKKQSQYGVTAVPYGTGKPEDTEEAIPINEELLISLDENLAGKKSLSDEILGEIAGTRVIQQEEAEIKRELRELAKSCCDSGVSIRVNRDSTITPEMSSLYQASFPLLDISRRMQRQLKRLFEREQYNSVRRGRIAGRRLDLSNLYRDDGVFCDKRLPQVKNDIAVTVLVDESGSMILGDRCKAARNASLILYDFCSGLNIPVAVYGHDASMKTPTVNLYSYAEFDSPDLLDRYRLMAIRNRDCNRDGAALKFAAERLLTRMEQTKLLILISDGKPSAFRYGGQEAIDELQKLAKEYANKGIVLFAAAIGSDKEIIESIYQRGYLDIGNLQELPNRMTKLITDFIRK